MTHWLWSQSRLLHHFFYSISSDCLSHICWPPPFLLLGCFCLDVPGRCPTLPHACGSIREWIFEEKVLLRCRIPLPRNRCWRLCRYRLQELWNREGVSILPVGGYYANCSSPSLQGEPTFGVLGKENIISHNHEIVELVYSMLLDLIANWPIFTSQTTK